MPTQLPDAAAQAWTPLLEGETAARAERAVLDVAEALGRPEALEDLEPELRPSFSRGLGGVAMFYGYLALARPGEGWEDRAVACLERALESIGEMKMTAGL